MEEQIKEVVLRYLSTKKFNIPRTKTMEDVLNLFIIGTRKAKWNSATAAKFISQFQEKQLRQFHYIWVLDFYNLKTCPKCKNLKFREDFHSNSHNCSGLQNYCKVCWQDHQKDNPEVWAQRTALRRARKAQATPPWVNLEELKDIYYKVPTGYHVDHIVPLTHPLVCGLHVPWNLQYLSPKENNEKSNKMDFLSEETRLLNTSLLV